MECKVPHTRISPKLIKYGRAWKRCIDDDKMRNVLTEHLGERIGNHEANVMSDHDHGAFDP